MIGVCSARCPKLLGSNTTGIAYKVLGHCIGQRCDSDRQHAGRLWSIPRSVLMPCDFCGVWHQQMLVLYTG